MAEGIDPFTVYNTYGRFRSNGARQGSQIKEALPGRKDCHK